MRKRQCFFYKWDFFCQNGRIIRPFKKKSHFEKIWRKTVFFSNFFYDFCQCGSITLAHVSTCDTTQQCITATLPATAQQGSFYTHQYGHDVVVRHIGARKSPLLRLMPTYIGQGFCVCRHQLIGLYGLRWPFKAIIICIYYLQYDTMWQTNKQGLHITHIHIVLAKGTLTWYNIAYDIWTTVYHHVNVRQLLMPLMAIIYVETLHYTTAIH